MAGSGLRLINFGAFADSIDVNHLNDCRKVIYISINLELRRHGLLIPLALGREIQSAVLIHLGPHAIHD